MKSTILLVYFALISLSFHCETGLATELPSIQLYGGISSPSPGYSVGIELTQSVQLKNRIGGSYLQNYNQFKNGQNKQTMHHLNGIYERCWHLNDRYHYLFGGVALGAAYLQKLTDDEDGDSSSKWGLSYGGHFGIELPIADLIGFRIATLLRHSSVKNTVVQASGVLGLRFGSEWLGLGN